MHYRSQHTSHCSAAMHYPAQCRSQNCYDPEGFTPFSYYTKKNIYQQSRSGSGGIHPPSPISCPDTPRASLSNGIKPFSTNCDNCSSSPTVRTRGLDTGVIATVSSIILSSPKDLPSSSPVIFLLLFFSFYCSQVPLLPLDSPRAPPGMSSLLVCPQPDSRPPAGCLLPCLLVPS